MRITARVQNQGGRHEVAVATEGREQPLAIAPKAAGKGSAVNGGELLCLALATCYCNDAYREAAARGVTLERVEVEVAAEFGAPGEPARSIEYRVHLSGGGDEAALRELARHTDAVAEVQSSLRGGVPVRLVEVTASSTAGGRPPA